MARYVTAQEIRDWLKVSDADVSEGKLTDSFLNSLIDEKMGYVDRLTNMRWNGETGTDEDYYSLTSFRGGWISYIGFPIYLKHTHIKQIQSLKVWNGSDYVEWIGSKTEGRDGDYWVDYIKGVLYINHRWLIRGTGKEVYVKYTYGRDDLPYEVKELTKLLVIRELLLRERMQFAVPEGAMAMRLSEMYDRIDKRIKELESYLRTLKVVRT